MGGNRNAVVAAARHGGTKGKRAVSADRAIVAKVVLQDEAAAGQARHIARDRVGVGDAVHLHVGDVGARERAAAVGHAAGLAGVSGLGQNRDAVRTAGQRGCESEWTIGADRAVVSAIVLQHESTVGQTRNVARYRVSIGYAAHLHVGDVGTRHSAAAAGHGAELTGGLDEDRDVVWIAGGDGGIEGKRAGRARGAEREVIAAVVPQDKAAAGQARDGAADGVSARRRRRIVRTAYLYIDDVGAPHRAAAVGDTAGLAGGLGKDRDTVRAAGRDRRAEGEIGGADQQIIRAAVLQHETDSA